MSKASFEPVRFLALILLAASAALLLLHGVMTKSIYYVHGWGSAHSGLMAEAFYKHGVFALGGIPVQNSGVILDTTDSYLHWPPLYPMVLAWIARPFGGVSISFLHIISAVFVLTQTAIIGYWLYIRVSSTASIAATLIFLNLPVIVWFGHAVIHIHLCFLFSLAAVVAFDFARSSGARFGQLATAGAIFYFLACMTSWEPFLMAPGFIFIFLLTYDRRDFHLVIIYGLAATLALIVTIVLFYLHDPEFLSKLFTRGMERAGLISYAGRESYPSIYKWSYLELDKLTVDRAREFQIGLGNMKVLGPFGIFAAVCLFVAALIACIRTFAKVIGKNFVSIKIENIPGFLVVLPLASTAFLWPILMTQHFAVHKYQSLVFAIPVAILSGLIINWLANVLYKFPPIATWLLVVPAIFIAIYVRLPHDMYVFANEKNTEFEHISKIINTSTPANAVVLARWYDLTITWYAKRNIVRGIRSPDQIRHVVRQIAAECPSCPVFRFVSETENPERTDGNSITVRGKTWYLRQIRPDPITTK